MSEAKRFETVIVGLGHAGRDLHWNAVREALGTTTQGRGVDPAADGGPGMITHRSRQDALRALDRERLSVFHVCVGPSSQPKVVRELMAAGIRNIIVEKPLGTRIEDVRELCRAARTVNVRMVAVWPHSLTVATAVAYMREAGLTPEVISIHQDKPRGAPRAKDPHTDALDVEIPHAVLLALHLAGPVEHLVGASLAPRADGRGNGLGGAKLCLRHRNGIITQISSDLQRPLRRRLVEVAAGHRRIKCSLPAGQESREGGVRVDGRLLWKGLDRPLTRFMTSAYKSFSTNESEPDHMMANHLAVYRVIDEARRTCLGNLVTT